MRIIGCRHTQQHLSSRLRTRRLKCRHLFRRPPQQLCLLLFQRRRPCQLRHQDPQPLLHCHPRQFQQHHQRVLPRLILHPCQRDGQRRVPPVFPHPGLHFLVFYCLTRIRKASGRWVTRIPFPGAIVEASREPADRLVSISTSMAIV